ncbi:predicted protein [Nematostella vectensis]|uniref:Uncharacterized protein n=1 Tax=Nematostella vectensis TaxID=45351 RepID=A7S0Y5_NEMVE|nr:predicted protein [Nematostella vectensis]|eukprot:XP_001634685.1 predicted protein [Nematostella vectensis]
MKTSLLLIAVFVVLLVLVSFPEDTNAVVFVLSQGKIRSIERQRQIKKLTKRIKRIKALNRGKRKKKHSKRSQKLREMRRWLRRFKQKGGLAVSSIHISVLRSTLNFALYGKVD